MGLLSKLQAACDRVGKGLSTSDLGLLAGAASAAFTIGVEAANVIRATVALSDADGLAMQQATALRVYMSSDAAGQTPATVTTSQIGRAHV